MIPLVLLMPLADKEAIKIKLLTNLNYTINADYTRLKQIIINLVSNAIKYNRKGGVINVSAIIVENDYVRLSISDTGIGISEKNKSKVFDAFNRLGQETSTIEGTGIGLVVTKELVEQMGGKIGFESVENEGSTFWVEFPIMHGHGHAKSKIKPIAKDIAIALEIPDTKKILYVEDNPTNRVFMRSFLESNQYYGLQLAETGERGWERAMEEEFDLILMDIHLPKMNGKELAQKLRATDHYKDKPILAVSAAVMKHDVESAGELFDAYVTKPIIITELMTLLNKYLK
ncbi:MAG: ATP-binding protein [Methylococcales bacterium]|nr:ATP-binding protein [Methylococcales bacterium]